MAGVELGGAAAEAGEEELVGVGGVGAEGVLPGGGGGEGGVEALGLVGKLVVEELVEEDLGDDLELVAIVAEAVVGADGLEVVNEGLGLGFKSAGEGHGWEIMN